MAEAIDWSSLTIRTLPNLKYTLARQVAEADMSVDGSVVNEIDLSGLQLLIAAFRTAEAAGRTFGVITTKGTVLANSLEAFGFVAGRDAPFIDGGAVP